MQCCSVSTNTKCQLGLVCPDFLLSIYISDFYCFKIKRRVYPLPELAAG